MAKIPHRLTADYGMLIVLLILGVLFTALTWKVQHPTGADAGRQIGEQAVAARPQPKLAIVVGRDTRDDRAFTSAAVDELKKDGIKIGAVVNGEPRDLRVAMDKIADDGGQVDAILVNEVTRGWPVYARYPQLEKVPRYTPRPYKGADFLKRDNLIGVANQTAIFAIIAIGMTMVIVTAGIDLSVGSLVALAAVISALAIRENGGEDASIWTVGLSLAGGVLLCGLAGAFNGLMVTRYRLPPFIVTLGMMMMASGAAFRLSEGRSISELPDTFLALGGGRMLGLPTPIWLMIGLYVVGHLLMSKTLLGRYIYAIGGNAEAARLSGVPVKRTLMIVYTVSGALAGLGGIVLASRLQSGDPKFGDTYELTVIAAVVVGGTSLMGGEGRVLGTLVGAFIITVIKNGMNLTNVDPYNQNIVLGAVLLVAVLVDTLKHRGSGGKLAGR